MAAQASVRDLNHVDCIPNPVKNQNLSPRQRLWRSTKRRIFENHDAALLSVQLLMETGHSLASIRDSSTTVLRPYVPVRADVNTHAIAAIMNVVGCEYRVGRVRSVLRDVIVYRNGDEEWIAMAARQRLWARHDARRRRMRCPASAHDVRRPKPASHPRRRHVSPHSAAQRRTAASPV